MCIILCIGLLYKPFQIVAESFRDLVDARPEGFITSTLKKCFGEFPKSMVSPELPG